MVEGSIHGEEDSVNLNCVKFGVWLVKKAQRGHITFPRKGLGFVCFLDCLRYLLLGDNIVASYP
jgi:hypothetical protein